MTVKKWDAREISDQKGRVVVITGASSGLGKEAAHVLAGKGATVLIAAQDKEKTKRAIEEICSEFPKANISSIPLDLASLRSVAECAHSIVEKYSRVDLLINNAGVMMTPYSTTEEGLEIQMGTNHFGHFALTAHLMPLISATENSRIVMHTSVIHKSGKIDFSDINWKKRKYSTVQAYSDSKLANIYFAKELARRLEKKGEGPLVTIAHPGWTATELQRHKKILQFLNKIFSQDVKMGVLPLLMAAFDEEAEGGDLYGPKGFLEWTGYPGKVQAARHAEEREAAEKLWALSEELTKVKFPI